MTFLNATQHRGFAVARAGRTLSSPFTAVILDGNRGLRTTPPNSFCRIDATTRVRPTHANADTLRKIENKFQAQLLCYRLHNWQQVSVETWDAPGLCGSTRALASVVGSCFPNKRAIQARTIELLTPQDEARKFDTACGEPAVVLDALLVLCHENKQEVHVGELTDLAIEILNVRGDRHQLLPRRVGAILKPFRLGHARDNRGYKFLLTTANQQRIHDLGRSYDIPFFKGDIKPCTFCRSSASPPAIVDGARVGESREGRERRVGDVEEINCGQKED